MQAVSNLHRVMTFHQTPDDPIPYILSKQQKRRVASELNFCQHIQNDTTVTDLATGSIHDFVDAGTCI